MGGNRLANEKSAYLRSAGHQPIDWLPWSKEVFERAKRDDKPILLDIGAVWCHWCHVMDRESYEDKEVAKFINENFVAVKVDRDERPDVDSRYQYAVQMMSNHGGWPLTAFLLPDGRCFGGGTYFPPDDSYDRPGFKTVLKRILGLYRDNKGHVMEHVERLSQELQRRMGHRHGDQKLDLSLVTEAERHIKEAFDPQYGGFGEAPKFPHTGAVELLMMRHHRTKDPEIRKIAELTLQRMAMGGMYDQLGGGFHRYSVDERWIVPHFEKMSYDNAELLRNYAHAFQMTRKDLYANVARDMIRYIDSVSDVSSSGFFASQDADQGPDDDGDYFTWTIEELIAAVDKEEAKVLALYYDVSDVGEMKENPRKNVLWVAQSPDLIAQQLKMPVQRVESLLDSGRKKMLAARGKRKEPFVDRTLYASWNGMMASAYLETWRALQDEPIKKTALSIIDRILAKLWDPARGFAHTLQDSTPHIFGLVDDNVEMAQALITAFEVTQDPKYLAAGEATMKFVVDKFWDAKNGGLMDTAKGVYEGETPALDSPNKPVMDTPTPSPNGVAAMNLDRLAALTGKEEYAKRASEMLDAFAYRARGLGVYAATYFLASEAHLSHPANVVVVGAKEDVATQALLTAAHRAFAPGRTVLLSEPGSKTPMPETARAAAESFAGKKPVALVCRGETCLPPADDPAKLVLLLESGGS